MEDISQWILFSSIIPYVISLFRGTVRPNMYSWFIWGFIGIVFYYTLPETVDVATKKIAFIVMIGPLGIFFLSLFVGEFKKPYWFEIVTLLIGVSAIITKLYIGNNETLYPIYLAIIADLCAAIPTFVFFLYSPSQEKPLAWILSFCGTFLALFAIKEINIENVLLPAYLSIVSFCCIVPLIYYRVKNQIPVKDWLIGYLIF